tara:strand:- start:112 stop:714 length:603 start_codon:yes stop_codon:yes gene_type:complete
MTTSGWGGIKSSWNSLSPLGQAGIASQGFGLLNSVVASYYGAQTEKYKTKMLALNLQHKKDMTLFNKSMKERQAWQIGRVYNHRLQILGLKQAQGKGKARASFAARGIQMGVGSTKDAFVSAEIVSEIDRLTMNSNKVRAMEYKKLEGVNLEIQSTMLGVSADNMFATASQISPWMNMSSSLLTGAGNIISSLPKEMLMR